MRKKYIEERLGFYFVFGEFSDGRVCIDDGSGTVFTTKKDEAITACDRLNNLVEQVWKMAEAFEKSNPVDFTKYWYEESDSGIFKELKVSKSDTFKGK